MRSLQLDTLLGAIHEHATFHDSELESINIDFPTNSVTLRFAIPCGLLPEGGFRYHKGALTFQDIYFYFVEASSYRPEMNDKPALWITSDGPLPDPSAEISCQIPDNLPQDAFAHYFYASTTNSFIVVTASHAVFNWQ